MAGLTDADANAGVGPYTEADKLHRAAWEENRGTISRNFGDNLEPPEITMPQTPAKVNGRAVMIEGVVRESAAGGTAGASLIPSIGSKGVLLNPPSDSQSASPVPNRSWRCRTRWGRRRR